MKNNHKLLDRIDQLPLTLKLKHSKKSDKKR